MLKDMGNAHGRMLPGISSLAALRVDVKARRPKPKDPTLPKTLDLGDVSRRWAKYSARPNKNRLYRFLSEVYALSALVRGAKARRRAVKKCAVTGGLNLRKSLDIFTVLIAAATIDNPAYGKQRSRWSRGLRYLESKDVKAEDCAAFLRNLGGICKAADKWAKSQRC